MRPTWPRCGRCSAHPRVVALGEVGLDFYRNNADPDNQRRVFGEQIDLANQLGLPLVIHTRDADHETFPMLERARVPVVLHCFSSPARLDEAIDRGYLMSFAGNVTYPAAAELAAAAERVPDELLLAETDSPYLAPVPLRGRRNVPVNVLHTLAFLAELRGVEPGRAGRRRSSATPPPCSACRELRRRSPWRCRPRSCTRSGTCWWAALATPARRRRWRC